MSANFYEKKKIYEKRWNLISISEITLFERKKKNILFHMVVSLEGELLFFLLNIISSFLRNYS